MLWLILILLALALAQLMYMGYVLRVGFNAVCASNARLAAAIENLHDEVRREARRNSRRDDRLDHPEQF